MVFGHVCRVATCPCTSSLNNSYRTITSSREEGISKYVDQAFDSAYNESQLAGDLPHVRWGRIDYLNVTHITTKWGLWQWVRLQFLTISKLMCFCFESTVCCHSDT